MQETIIDLIRHGQPQGGSVYRGHNIDDPLSELGWQQMWNAVEHTAPWNSIISSPMLRCREFAYKLAEKNQLPVAIDERFKEVGFGSWEGCSRSEIRDANPKEYDDFYSDPINCRPAGAEPIDDFIQRVTRAYDDVLAEHQGQHCLIVAHAGVIRAVVAHVLHAAAIGLYKIQVDNASITRISHNQYGSKLEYLNQT